MTTIKDLKKKYENRNGRLKGLTIETSLGNQFEIIQDDASGVIGKCIRAITKHVEVGKLLPFDDANEVTEVA